MKLIVISKTNIASNNLGKILKEKYKFPKDVCFFETQNSVLNFEQDPNFQEAIKSPFASDPRQTTHDKPLVIVPSTHKSKDGINTLTCHSPGNWGDAALGGEKSKLSIAPALYLRTALLELQKQKEKLNIDYEVSLEVTHHSPTIDLPIIFVEVGSSEKQWNDLIACSAVAEVIYKLVTEKIEQVEIGVGFGGTHYAPTFTKRVLDGNIAIGHICPKYYTPELTEQMFLQAVNKTTPKPDYVVLDWKGLKANEKQNIIKFCEQNKLVYRKSDEFKSR